MSGILWDLVTAVILYHFDRFATPMLPLRKVSLFRYAGLPNRVTDLPYWARQRPKNIKIWFYRPRNWDVTVTRCPDRHAGGLALHVTGEPFEMVQYEDEYVHQSRYILLNESVLHLIRTSIWAMR